MTNWAKQRSTKVIFTFCALFAFVPITGAAKSATAFTLSCHIAMKALIFADPSDPGSRTVSTTANMGDLVIGFEISEEGNGRFKVYSGYEIENKGRAVLAAGNG